METKIEFDQLKVLEDFFYDLSVTDQRKVFLTGFRKAARPLVKAAKAGAPKGKTGNLEHSIGTMAVTQEIAIIVGARKGGGRYRGWHGHLMEHGTRQRVRKSGGSTGRVIGKKFFETAFYQTQEKMYGEIDREWYQAIDRKIININKKL